eukprot:g2934.t1
MTSSHLYTWANTVLEDSNIPSSFPTKDGKKSLKLNSASILVLLHVVCPSTTGDNKENDNGKKKSSVSKTDKQLLEELHDFLNIPSDVIQKKDFKTKQLFLYRLLELTLVCAVQGERAEINVQNIMKLQDDVQATLMHTIESVGEFINEYRNDDDDENTSSEEEEEEGEGEESERDTEHSFHNETAELTLDLQNLSMTSTTISPTASETPDNVINVDDNHENQLFSDGQHQVDGHQTQIDAQHQIDDEQHHLISPNHGKQKKTNTNDTNIPLPNQIVDHNDTDLSLSASKRNHYRLAREIDALQEENEELRNEMHTSIQHVETLRGDKEALKAELQRTQSKYRDIEEELVCYRREVEETRHSQNQMTQQTIASLKSQLKTAQAKVVDYRSLQDELELAKDAAARCTKAETSVVRLRTKLASLGDINQEVERLKASNARLMQRALDAEAQVVEMTNLRKQLKICKGKITELEFQKADMKMKLEHVGKQRERFEKEVSRIQDLRDKEKKFQSPLRSKKGEASEILAAQAAALSKNSSSSAMELDPIIQERLKKLERENINLKRKVNATSLENVKDLESKLEDSQRLTSTFQKQFYDMREEKERLEKLSALQVSRIQDLQGDLETTQNILGTCEQDLTDLKQNHHQLEMTYRELQNVEKDLLNTKANLTSELSNAQDAFDTLTKELATERNRFAQKYLEQERCQEMAANERETLIYHLRWVMKVQIPNLDTDMMKQRRRYKRLVQEHATHIASLEEKHDGLMQSHQNKYETLTKELKREKRRRIFEAQQGKLLRQEKTKLLAKLKRSEIVSKENAAMAGLENGRNTTTFGQSSGSGPTPHNSYPTNLHDLIKELDSERHKRKDLAQAVEKLVIERNTFSRKYNDLSSRILAKKNAKQKKLPRRSFRQPPTSTATAANNTSSTKSRNGSGLLLRQKPTRVTSTSKTPVSSMIRTPDANESHLANVQTPSVSGQRSSSSSALSSSARRMKNPSPYQIEHERLLNDLDLLEAITLISQCGLAEYAGTRNNGHDQSQHISSENAHYLKAMQSLVTEKDALIKEKQKLMLLK